MYVKRGVREGLFRRCETVLREMVSKVRVSKEGGERFWTERGVILGCLLSPVLFVLFLPDLDEELGKGRCGRVGRGKEGERAGICG